jgi:hypothetical protein
VAPTLHPSVAQRDPARPAPAASDRWRNFVRAPAATLPGSGSGGIEGTGLGPPKARRPQRRWTDVEY